MDPFGYPNCRSSARIVNTGWIGKNSSLYSETIEFARDKLDFDVIELDAGEEFNANGWQKCCEHGIAGWTVPRAYGGSEYELSAAINGLEALGYACKDNGLIFGLSAQIWACQAPVLRFGTEGQKNRYLPGLCRGELIGAHAATEQGAGSDIYALATTASPDGDHYVLNGQKSYITNAPVAGLFLIFARLPDASGPEGLSCFLVEREVPGLSVVKNSKMGVRSAQMGEITLSDCRVPVDAMLGNPGAGMALFNHAMEWERAFILTPALGTMRRILEQCIAFARRRKQGGRAIGKYQMVAEKIVEMKVRLEQVRGLLYQAAWSKQNGEVILLESAMIKYAVSEAYVQACLDALQIFGGRGYLRENEIERELRDALASRLYSGTSEIQKNLIAGLLGL